MHRQAPVVLLCPPALSSRGMHARTGRTSVSLVCGRAPGAEDSGMWRDSVRLPECSVSLKERAWLGSPSSDHGPRFSPGPPSPWRQLMPSGSSLASQSLVSTKAS